MKSLFQVEEIKNKNTKEVIDTSWFDDVELLKKRTNEIRNLFPKLKPKHVSHFLNGGEYSIKYPFDSKIEVVSNFLKEKDFTEKCQYIRTFYHGYSKYFLEISKIFPKECEFLKKLIKEKLDEKNNLKNSEDKNTNKEVIDTSWINDEEFIKQKRKWILDSISKSIERGKSISNEEVINLMLVELNKSNLKEKYQIIYITSFLDIKPFYLKKLFAKTISKVFPDEYEFVKNLSNKIKISEEIKQKIYLNSITFKEDYHNLKKGFTINFKPLTLLVGEQGSGKSTVLSLLRDNNKKTLTFDLTEETIKKGIKTFYFDTEKDNPRIKDLHHFSNPNGTSKSIGIGGKLQTHFKSHGEVLKFYTVDLLRKTEPSVIFIDEPESSLSLKNQYELIKSLNIAINNGAQVILATHCLPLIQSVEEVFDMEIGKWVSSKEFIKKSK